MWMTLVLVLQVVAAVLIGVGVAGRIYFQNKAHKARLELNRRYWERHDEQIKRIRRGEITADEAIADMRQRLKN